MKSQDSIPKPRIARHTFRIAALLALVGTYCAPSVAQDAKAIVEKVCVTCHGEDGNSIVDLFPKIAGLQEEYIVKQLRDFQTGRRKSDIMMPVVASLKPEDYAPLAAWFSAQKRKPGVEGDRKVATLGKLIYFDGNEETGVPACVGCHQPQGTGHQIYPRIGGQHSPYLKQQLKNFASGDRSNDVNRFMRVIAKRLSDDEIDAIATYLVGLDSK